MLRSIDFARIINVALLSLALFVAAEPAQASYPASVKWIGWNGNGVCIPFGCKAYVTQGEVWAAQEALFTNGCSWVTPPIYHNGTFPGESWKRLSSRWNGTSCVTPDPNVITNYSFAIQNGSTLYCPTKNAAVVELSCICINNTIQAGNNCTAGQNNGTGGTGSCTIGNPCNPASGNKVWQESVYRGAGTGALDLALTFNSFDPQASAFGTRWRHAYERKVVAEGANYVVYRPDGKAFLFTPSGGNWVTTANIGDVLVQTTSPAGWQWRAADQEEIETYDSAGRLLSVQARSGLARTFVHSDGTGGANGGFVLDASGNPTAIVLPAGLLIRMIDPFGRVLAFGYDLASRVTKATDPNGGVYRFAYDAQANLASITYPDTKVRTFHYNEPANTSSADLPNALTGITDENGARFATYQYNSSEKVTRTEHAGGAIRYQFSYVTGSTSVTDPLNTVRTYNFSTVLGAYKNTGITGGACPSCGPASRTYDSNGNIATSTDWNGNRTNYTYDLARKLETSRTEALTSGGSTTAQTRKISTTWHGTFRLPTGIAEPLRITTFTYDATGSTCGAAGALCSKSIQATTDTSGASGFSVTPSGSPRTWTYTYNTNGSVLTVNGPRTDVADVTAYTYYADDDADLGNRGNVSSISNALGQTTNITAYNAHGQPLAIVDANGLTTTLVYDARQRLASRSVGGELTSYDYDGVGQLTKVTLPDGSYLSYTYDDAHRLTELSDNLGNRITYTLDVMGNRTAEQVRDPSNALAQTRSREYNNLNRLFHELGAQGQTTEYAYDDQGNVTSVKDPLNHTTANQYDALNRLKQVTDPGLSVTQYGYNGLDALTSVTDPRNLVTGYSVDGLGNLNQQVSPDTGTTANTYDAAGNLLTQTDAKGQVTTYVYDALNRVALITFHDNAKQQYIYDTGANGVGRLASITELDPAAQQTHRTSYSYDQHGRVLTIATLHAGVTYTLGYSYDSAGRLSGLAYPSGRTVTYGFDALGRVSQVTTQKPGDSQQTVVSSVAYHPFGGVKGYTLGNGHAYTRSIDLDGRIASYTLGAKSFGIGYDAASRIEFISDLGDPANINGYGYDALDRLTSAVTPGVPYAYGYDAVGNRTSKTVAASTDTYTYSPSSNRIATVGSRSFSFDANGSTTNDGNNAYAYDTRGRMVQATSVIGATNYKVNALGQRIRKTNTLGDTVFHYGTSGKLIAETDPGGALKRELIYLGDIPVGAVQ